MDSALRWISRQAIYLYQKTISPDKGIFSSIFQGRICAHEPHCSEYAIRTLHRYPFSSSWRRIMERISSCTVSHNTIYDPDHYRVVFCSSAPIGIPFLKALQEDSRYEVVGLLTRAGKAQGRGQRIQNNPVHKYWSNTDNTHASSLRTPGSLRLGSKKYKQEAEETRQWLSALQPDFLIVIAYGHILPQDILDIARLAPINIHGSLLPKYRGASPIQSALLHEDAQTGISIMRMVAQLDQGPIISKHAFPLGLNDTAVQVIQKMKKVGPSALLHSLEEYAKKRKNERPQKDTHASYCTKIQKEHGQVNFLQDSLSDIFRLHKAYALRPRVYRKPSKATKYPRPLQKRVTIRKLLCQEDTFAQHKDRPLITYVDNTWKLNPCIQELHLQVEGKQTCTWKDFVNGYLQ